MLDKSCPQCNRDIGLGRFLGAVTGAKTRLLCPGCGRSVKGDLSLFVGLFYFGFAAVFLPVLMIFGMGKNVGGRALERIQQIFDVGPGAAFAIGIGTIIGFLLLYLMAYAIAFAHIEFERAD